MVPGPKDVLKLGRVSPSLKSDPKHPRLDFSAYGLGRGWLRACLIRPGSIPGLGWPVEENWGKEVFDSWTVGKAYKAFHLL